MKKEVLSEEERDRRLRQSEELIKLERYRKKMIEIANKEGLI